MRRRSAEEAFYRRILCRCSHEAARGISDFTEGPSVDSLQGRGNCDFTERDSVDALKGFRMCDFTDFTEGASVDAVNEVRE